MNVEIGTEAAQFLSAPVFEQRVHIKKTNNKFSIWKSMDPKWKQIILGVNFLFSFRVYEPFIYSVVHYAAC
jgi:hypothetical protein